MCFARELIRKRPKSPLTTEIATPSIVQRASMLDYQRLGEGSCFQCDMFWVVLAMELAVYLTSFTNVIR